MLHIDSFGKEPLVQAKQSLGFKEMAVPISAGILSALRRVIARRVSLKVLLSLMEKLLYNL